MLTSDDLDALGMASFTDGEAPAAVAQLIAAVAEERLADPGDATYALLLAAEISERQGDLSGAAHLTDQAATLARGGADDGWARSSRAGLLARSGRADEAMTAFTELRPLLIREPDAAAYLPEALEEAGHAAVAEQWLTAALKIVLSRPDDEAKVELAYALLQSRHRLRRELDEPLDPFDDLADRMRTTAEEPEPRNSGAEVFWPAPEFDRLLLRWPALAEEFGSTWDAHRAQVETALAALSARGEQGLGFVRGSADDLYAFATRAGGDPTTPEALGDYLDHTESVAGTTPWPPARNDACWCGSGAKYKKCCLPRSRT